MIKPKAKRLRQRESTSVVVLGCSYLAGEIKVYTRPCENASGHVRLANCMLVTPGRVSKDLMAVVWVGRRSNSRQTEKEKMDRYHHRFLELSEPFRVQVPLVKFSASEIDTFGGLSNPMQTATAIARSWREIARTLRVANAGDVQYSMLTYSMRLLQRYGFRGTHLPLIPPSPASPSQQMFSHNQSSRLSLVTSAGESAARPCPR